MESFWTAYNSEVISLLSGMSIETIVYHGYGSRRHEGDYADDIEL